MIVLAEVTWPMAAIWIGLFAAVAFGWWALLWFLMHTEPVQRDPSTRTPLWEYRRTVAADEDEDEGAGEAER